MEQSTLRSRSFRRLFLASCSLFILAVTLHSFNTHTGLRQRLAHLNQANLRKEAYARSSHPRHADIEQAALVNEDVQPEEDVLSVEDHVKGLPDVVRIPFEEAVKDVILHGWEDEWLSSANFNSQKFDSLQEPKLDFVYNCKCCTFYTHYA